jgi:hypothetical protein
MRSDYCGARETDIFWIWHTPCSALGNMATIGRMTGVKTMYTPTSRKLPSATAAILATATLTFMTFAAMAENGVYGGDTRVATAASAPSGLCMERSATNCDPIRA